MRTAVLGLDDASEWRAAVEQQSLADVYYLPEYHAAAAANGEGEPFLFVAQDGPHALLHPFLLRPIDGSRTDIETVYGYTGPITTCTGAEFMDRAWREFDRWCVDRRVVAEFVRFNPLSENERLAGGRYEVTVARPSVIVPLGASPEDLWIGYPQVQRNMVRRAEREGMTVEELEGPEALEVFIRLYADTMERVEASARYRFSHGYFIGLAKGLGDALRIHGVRLNGEIVVAGMFLLYRDRMHYHLAGSTAGGRRAGANNLLLHGAALRGLREGRRWLHLGGGLTDRSDDALYRFKGSVSRLMRPACVGVRIHDRPAYDELCAAWLRTHGVTERPGFFLLWRLDE